jgi:hypothetical protein
MFVVIFVVNWEECDSAGVDEGMFISCCDWSSEIVEGIPDVFPLRTWFVGVRDEETLKLLLVGTSLGVRE